MSNKGGAATINQYLAAGLIDELRTHIAPVTLGAGERLFDRVPPLQLALLAVRGASLTTHPTPPLPPRPPPRGGGPPPRAPPPGEERGAGGGPQGPRGTGGPPPAVALAGRR